MNVRSVFLMCITTVFSTVSAVHAVTPQGMLDEAIGLYDVALNTQEQGLRTERFRRANRLFRQVAFEQEIQNADLYTNQGNAALQSELIGAAILAYLRALTIEPGHSQARENLEYARGLLPQWVPRPQTQTLIDTFLFWHRALARSGRALVAAITFAFTAVLLAIAIRWRRAWARHTAMLGAVIWITLISLSLWPRFGILKDAVVITAPQVVARTADSAGAPPRFAHPLPAGTEAEVIQRRASWVRIRLANGRDAWVRASSVASVQKMMK